ncbi:FeoA family protein [Intestinicryptomonas porci]|uniref:Ferrous iron transport protein A n=1 Tax=Intestinicryptomonas porci TaxID=2926320 RepID=A0ABU4WF68_9BACT|nr:ferrous iron transport protein A [Opitutales bacterium CLA-KB-P66]
MEKLLSEFSPNESGRVVKILGGGRLRRRIFDMGITPDTEILMRKSAPLGDPIEVSLRGYELSLRKAEASLIKMRVEK